MIQYKGTNTKVPEIFCRNRQETHERNSFPVDIVSKERLFYHKRTGIKLRRTL